MKMENIIIACIILTCASASSVASKELHARTEMIKLGSLKPPVISTRGNKITQTGKIISPTVAARRLYNAWRSRNRRLALKVASPEAVSKLFSVRWRPMRLKGCDNENGSFECIYHDAKLDLDLAMVVEGGVSAGYHVETISFSTEAAFLPADNSLTAVRVE